MKKILFSILLILNFAHADFRTVNETQLKQAIEKGVVVIDIRRPQEWQQFGIIPSSQKITFFDQFGKYDVKAWMSEFSKHVKTLDQPFILVCARANRTKAVGKMLSEQAGFANVYDLEGGIINGWIKKGEKATK